MKFWTCWLLDIRQIHSGLRAWAYKPEPEPEPESILSTQATNLSTDQLSASRAKKFSTAAVFFSTETIFSLDNLLLSQSLIEPVYLKLVVKRRDLDTGISCIENKHWYRTQVHHSELSEKQMNQKIKFQLAK